MKKTILVVVAAIAASTLVSTASWTLLPLPPTAPLFAGYANTPLTHLPDGRYVYGHNGRLIQQDAFGGAAFTEYSAEPSGDFAFLTPGHIGLAFTGVGSFDATNPASTYVSRTTAVSPYSGAARAGGNLILTGVGSGTQSGLFHLADDGTLTTLVAEFSLYSGAVAVDDVGDVYVGYASDSSDPLDGNIYRYTAAQIAAAISGTTLTRDDATLIADLGATASLAVDRANQRIYAAGFIGNGIRVFDWGSAESGTLRAPGLTTPYYQLSMFSQGGDSYLGWVNRGGYNGNDTMTYGYGLASTLPIPEPSAALIVLSGLVAVITGRRRAA